MSLPLFCIHVHIHGNTYLVVSNLKNDPVPRLIGKTEQCKNLPSDARQGTILQATSDNTFIILLQFLVYCFHRQWSDRCKVAGTSPSVPWAHARDKLMKLRRHPSANAACRRLSAESLSPMQETICSNPQPNAEDCQKKPLRRCR